MVQVLQRLALQFERLDDRDLSRIVLVARRPRDLHLLNSNHLTRRRVQRQVYTAVRSLSNQLSTHPAENG